jgi:dihydroorotate dehydrogenase (NAD+) catalytic subunit
MKTDLKIKFAGIELKNPICSASGTFGYGYELADLIPLKKLGAIVTKTITLEPKTGNPQPRIAEVCGGLLNSIGLQNIGVRAFIDSPLENLKKIGIPIFVSIAGACIKDYIENVKVLNIQKGLSAIELNLSCPNLEKQIICHNEKLMQEIIKAVKKISNLPIIVKLSPLITDIAKLSLLSQKAGADALTLANTYPAMAIDIQTFKPKLSTIKGGLSGSCIKPMAIRCVYDAYQNIKIPILGCGGIMSADDVIEFMLAGAQAVSIGTASLLSPKNLIKIIDDLEQILIDKKIKNSQDLVGKIKK